MIGRELLFDPTARRIVFAATLPVMLVVAGTVGYHSLEGWGYFDSLYMTVHTLATVGFGETHPLSQNGRVFTIFLIMGGAFTMAAAVTSVIRSIVSGEVQRLLGRQRMERMLASVTNHVIVCGYGRMGRIICEAAQRTSDRGGIGCAKLVVFANAVEDNPFMAGAFYGSPEYLAFNRDDDGYVTDLYGTFFNRAPDAGGFSDWKAQLAAGMPREVVLASFMFSAEFSSFTQAIFGTTSTRREVDTVVDFYRGLLSRLPDDGGFASWVGQFRAAQCAGATAVYNTVESISSGFANSGEYASRNRTNAQYVGDLYNAFLRRGGDLGGVQFWINELATGNRTRNKVRQDFIASPEFTSRANAIIAEGCVP